MSKGLDPDQDRRFVYSDLGPNCLQRFSAVKASKQRVKKKKNLCNIKCICFILYVCFLALHPKSTAMVMAGQSVHLTTLFPGQA